MDIEGKWELKAQKQYLKLHNDPPQPTCSNNSRILTAIGMISVVTIIMAIVVNHKQNGKTVVVIVANNIEITSGPAQEPLEWCHGMNGPLLWKKQLFITASQNHSTNIPFGNQNGHGKSPFA